MKMVLKAQLCRRIGSVQDVMIRLPATDNDSGIGDRVKGMLQEVDSGIKIRSVEFVGPNVGEELAQGAVYATLATLAMMLVYVGSRFEWRLGFGGIASLAHDVIITLGVFSALQIEIDLTFVAAFCLLWVILLTIVSWSLTVCVKISENKTSRYH